MNKPRVIVIGLDGATWDLIKPWADEGKLPTFKKLIENGMWGYLKSTLPPVTFPAWSSIFTGVNPAKLGVYNFVELDTKKRSFRVNTPRSFKCTYVWDILSKYDYKCCVINVPTCRVYEINGIIVGGPFCVDENPVYPFEYKQILNQVRYKIYSPDITPLSLESDSRPSIQVIKEIISSRFQLAKYIVEKEKIDFLVLVIFITDTIQHFYWDDAILYQMWKYIDKEIESFISDFLEDSFIFFISDHGFAEFYKTFYISRFLSSLGLIRYNRIKLAKFYLLSKFKKYLPKFLKLLKSFKLLKYIPVQRILNLENQLRAKSLIDIIDWGKSVAIPIEQFIYLNCAENQKEKLKKYIKEELENLEVIEKVFYKEEVYNGPFIDRAPDLVVLTKKGVDIYENPFSNDILSDKPRDRWKALHSIDGIFLLVGPNIKPTENINVSVYDIAPTILYLFGIPPSPEMDGKVLPEIAECLNFRKKHKLERIRIKHKVRELRRRL